VYDLRFSLGHFLVRKTRRKKKEYGRNGIDKLGSARAPSPFRERAYLLIKHSILPLFMSHCNVEFEPEQLKEDPTPGFPVLVCGQPPREPLVFFLPHSFCSVLCAR